MPVGTTTRRRGQSKTAARYTNTPQEKKEKVDVLYYRHPSSPSAARHFRTLTRGGRGGEARRAGGRKRGGRSHLSLLLLPGRIQEEVPVPVVLLLHVHFIFSVILLHIVSFCVLEVLDVSASLPGEVMSHSGVSAPSTLRHAFNTVSVCMEEINGPPPALFFFFFYFVTHSLSSLSLSPSPTLSLSGCSSFLLPGGSTQGGRQADSRRRRGGEGGRGEKNFASDKSNRSEMPQCDWMPPGPHDPPP